MSPSVVTSQASFAPNDEQRVLLAKRCVAHHAPIVTREELKAEENAEEQRFLAATATDKERARP